MSEARSTVSWLERRQSLLFAACKGIATLRKDQIPIARAIRTVAGKFRSRSLGSGHRLALSCKTMRRHWDTWNATPAKKRNESIFRSRYNTGHTKAELHPLLLPLIAEFGIQQGRTLGQVLRIVRPTTVNGKPLSKRTIHRRVPAREIQKIAFAHRRIARLSRQLGEQKTALVTRVLGTSLR